MWCSDGSFTKRICSTLTSEIGNYAEPSKAVAFSITSQLNFKVLFIMTRTTGGKAVMVALLLLETISQLALMNLYD